MCEFVCYLNIDWGVLINLIVIGTESIHFFSIQFHLYGLYMHENIIGQPNSNGNRYSTIW